MSEDHIYYIMSKTWMINVAREMGLDLPREKVETVIHHACDDVGEFLDHWIVDNLSEYAQPIEGQTPCMVFKPRLSDKWHLEDL